MTSVQVEPGFAFTSPEYRALYDRSDATAFQHPVWLDRLYGMLAPAVGAEALVVTGRDEYSGGLRFVLPLVRIRDRYVRRVEFADLGVSDYAAPVVDPHLHAEFHDGGIARAVRSVIGHCDIARIDKVAGDPAAVTTLLGTRSVREHDYATHAIPLYGTFESWRDGLDPKFVRHLNDKRKRLQRSGRIVDVHEIRSADEIDPAFVRMREFRQARFADRRAIDLVQDTRYYEFYREVARFSAESGNPGSTRVLTVNDNILAVSFCLQTDDRDVGLLIGYDIAQWRNYSLGLLLVEDLIAASFTNRKKVHDLTLGHDNYKRSFGAVSAPMHSIRVPMTARGRAAQIRADQNANARRLAKRALAFQERRFPQLDVERRVRRLFAAKT